MSSKAVTIKASGAATATSNSGGVAFPTELSDKVIGIHLVLDITAASGTTPTLDVTVERYDPVSRKYIALPGAAFAQKNTTGTDDLTIYPGIAETANRSVSDVLTDSFRVVWTIGGTTPSFTFSLGGHYLL